MNQEQKERLTAWYLNILVTYRIDYFRGRVIASIMDAIERVTLWHLDAAEWYCREANGIGFSPDTKDYTELLKELRQVAKEVPLSDAAQEAIIHVFGGDWDGAIEAIYLLRRECNGQK